MNDKLGIYVCDSVKIIQMMVTKYNYWLGWPAASYWSDECYRTWTCIVSRHRKYWSINSTDWSNKNIYSKTKRRRQRSMFYLKVTFESSLTVKKVYLFDMISIPWQCCCEIYSKDQPKMPITKHSTTFWTIYVYWPKLLCNTKNTI